jgi:hypothetical protein
MLSIRSLVKKLDVFERNKAPLDLKVLGSAFYVQLCSLRRAVEGLGAEIDLIATINSSLD